MKKRTQLIITIGMVLPAGLAAASTGTGLPWELPLQTVANSLTGPVAYAVGLIGMFGAAAMLLFGGELSDWTKRVVLMVFALSLVVNAANLYTTLFGASTSNAKEITITPPQPHIPIQ